MFLDFLLARPLKLRLPFLAIVIVATIVYIFLYSQAQQMITSIKHEPQEMRIEMLSFEERLAYYLTNVFILSNKSSINNSIDVPLDFIADAQFLLSKERMLNFSKSLTFDGKIDEYVEETLEIIENHPHLKHCEFLVMFGDITPRLKAVDTVIKLFKSDFPVLMKARYIGKQNVLLLKYIIHRHWEFWETVDRYDIPFEDKKSEILWRGGNNDPHGYRHGTVKKYFNDSHSFINIAYPYKLQEIHVDKGIYTRMRNWFLNRIWGRKNEVLPIKTADLSRPKLTLEQMMQSKYLVSIPGNDVATNLGWILYSNSVPFTYHPFVKETWLMHGLLRPYVHYIPFNFHDDSLLEGYEFCESNPENCSQIALNGKHWMMQFKNETMENALQHEILRQYCTKVSFF